MSRYIDENEVYKLVGDIGIAKIHCAQIDDLPRADVAEMKHGKWIEKKDGFACSNCKKRAGSRYGISGAYLSNYCPHCGAKMDEKVSD